MTRLLIGSRLLAVLLAVAAGACGAAASAAAAPSVATAPGRVVIDIGRDTLLTGVNPFGGFQGSVSQPDGSMLLLFGSGLSPSTVRVMRIGLDGAPDRSFGDAGVKIVDLKVSAYDRSRIIRQPDGKLVIVSSVAESFGAKAIPTYCA